MPLVSDPKGREASCLLDTRDGSHGYRSDVERRTVERLLARLREALDSDLRAVCLYGARARGETPHDESDVDLMVIADSGHERYQRVAMDLSAEAAGRGEAGRHRRSRVSINDIACSDLALGAP